VAAKLARLLQGGEVIELASDLGGGKTTFVQGLAAALGYKGDVTSPTFTLSQIYTLESGLELHHYDLYRLGQSGVVGEELAEDLEDPHNITLIEWAGLVADELPVDRLRIEIEPTGDTERVLHISAGGPVSERLLKGLQS
jgi:tRNA threonylcarbamoyladenosine biosynthesis protein TsaE